MAAVACSGSHCQLIICHQELYTLIVTGNLQSMPAAKLLSKSTAMKLIIGLAAVLFSCFCFGQDLVKPLSIGDTVPNVAITPVLNYATSNTSLAHFSDKLLILDFMTTGCAACIRGLPALDSLQKAFAGEVQVLLVTPETKARVQAFLKREYIKELQLPVIAADTMLARLFPFSYTPHEVIINKGRVAAITYPEFITVQNVKAIIAGTNKELLVKRDVDDFQYEKPLVVLNEAIIPDFSLPEHRFYSVITNNLINVHLRYTVLTDTLSNTRRISIINLPILDMYIRTQYGDELRPAFIELNVADTGRYVYKKDNGYLHDWRVKNTYCYEGTFPLSLSQSAIRKKIASDLDFYLGVHGSLEKRRTQCLIIKQDSNTNVKRPAEVFKEHERPAPVTISSLIFYLNGSFGNTPAIDETGEGDLIIHGLDRKDYTNIDVLQRKLKEYGLQIITVARLIDMLVLTEDNSNNLSIQNH
jgi:thiol-disulfide isomerase/thioredoxin